MLWGVREAGRGPSQSADIFESGNQVGFVTILLNSPICRRLGQRSSRRGVTYKLKKTWTQTGLVMLQYFQETGDAGDELIVCAAFC